jgi:hypothetical protein
MATDTDKPDDPLESQEFFDLMQAYRHAPIVNQAAVVDAYDKVKRFIRVEFTMPLAVAREFIAEHVGVEPELERDSLETE